MLKFLRSKSFIIVLFFLLISFSIFLFWQRSGVKIITDRDAYESGSVLKLDISNLFVSNICFSSCYPYNVEYKDEGWQSYNYPGCPKPNLAETCLKPGETKRFELNVFALRKGNHRLAIPVCYNCKENEDFVESQKFYSNIFTIK